MKTAGKRTPTSSERGFTQKKKDFLELCVKLRKKTVFIRRGVYRFKSHEEANSWAIRMMLGEKPADPPQ